MVYEHRRGAAGIQLRPLDPIDFEERKWAPHSGWPLSKAHLDPFYQRAQSICGLGPYQYDASNSEDLEERPCLPFLQSSVKTVIFQLGARDTFIGNIRNQISHAKNITTYLHATATEVETSANTREVTGICLATSRGKTAWVHAKIFVLALGGIETPRLLLLSNKTNSQGVGDDRDFGRFFMEHPHLLSGSYVTSKLDVERLAKLYQFHTVKNARIYGRLALAAEVLQREQLLNYSVAINTTFWPLTIRACIDNVRQSCHHIGHAMRTGQIKEVKRELRELVPFLFNQATPIVGGKVASLIQKKVVNKVWRARKTKTFLLNHMSEQAPNPDSRVTLSDELDPFGQRRIQLNWQLSPLDMRTIIRAQHLLDGELCRAGLGRLEIELKSEVPPPDLHGGWHHMGTTRMHKDPRKGVVNEHCQVHGIHNLFIAGPSVFPTGGYANPTLTIVALATRLADHVKARVITLIY